ncbi:MAG: hypothetical protein ACRDIZ_08590 [Actinomycetota bacterium]
MPRKKSIRAAANRFIRWSEALETYYRDIVGSDLGAQTVTWACESAVVKLHVYFEHLMLDTLVGAINNNTSTLTHSTGINFPRHLTDEVCEYIVTGGRFFDFRGRDGLIKLLKRYVPEKHYVVRVVKKQRYRQTLEHLVALRNLAAHESRVGKRVAKDVVDPSLGSAGVWLRRDNRFLDLTDRLKELARELRRAAPY